MLRYYLIIIVAGLLAPSSAFSQCQTNVAGSVVNKAGKPIARARVSFIEMTVAPDRKGSITGGLVRTPVEADNNGSFQSTLTIYDPGWYWVVANKLDAGYPDARLSFYVGHKPLQVNLICGDSLHGLIVKLGSKAAYIRKISVVDATTGKPIPSAEITLWRLSSPIPELRKDQLSIKSSVAASPKIAQLELALPSNADIEYVMSAPGYRKSDAKLLHPKPGEQIDLAVVLEPVNK